MKKLISILMVLSLLAGFCTITASAKTTIFNSEYYLIDEIPNSDTEILGILGDIDISGTVNIKDATTIQKFLASLVELPQESQVLADTDLSGDITVRDATAIQKWIAELPLPTGEYIDTIVCKDIVVLPTVPDIIGTWQTNIDIADTLNTLIATYTEDPFVKEMVQEMVPGFNEFHLISENIHIETCPITAVYTFDIDDNYYIVYDEPVLTQTMDTVKEDLKGDVESFLKAYAKEKHLPLTPDQMVALMGFESVDAIFDEMLPADMVSEYLAPVEGTYRAENGKLYMDGAEDVYETYTVEDDTLTLTGTSGELPEDIPADILSSMYPITFTIVE